MTWLKDPTHIALILTAVTTVISEILPFVPTKANGILQGILRLLGVAKQALPAATKAVKAGGQ